MKLSIIIPAHNEEKRLGKTITSIYNTFQNDFEVIVVSNGSADKTPNILKEAEAQYNNFKAIIDKNKLGKGGAILAGLKVAKGDIIGFFDADDAFDLQQVKEILDNFPEGYDCFIASKWLEQKCRQVNEPISKKIFSRCWNILARTILGLNFCDTQGGLKFLKRSAFESIGNNFISRGFEFDVELLWKLQQKGFKIKEIFIKNKYVLGSTFNMKYALPMLINILKMGWSRLAK